MSISDSSLVAVVESYWGAESIVGGNLLYRWDLWYRWQTPLRSMGRYEVPPRHGYAC